MANFISSEREGVSALKGMVQRASVLSLQMAPELRW